MNSIFRHVFLVILGLVLLCQAKASDWTRFRGADLRGSSPEPILTSWPTNGPKEVWTKTYSTNVFGASSWGYSSFAVCQGKIFTLEYGSDYFEYCVALNPANGAKLWSVKLEGGQANSTPTFSDGRVYVYSGTGKLLCLNPANGQILWHRTVDAEMPMDYSQSPWVEDGRVFVSLMRSTNNLKAFNATNGTLIWEGQNDYGTYGSPVGATIHGIRQIIFPVSYGLVAVAPDTGRLLWRHPQNPLIYNQGPSPVVCDDMVLAYPHTQAIRIDYTNESFTAKSLWTNTCTGTDPSTLYTTLVVQENYAYILDGGKLSCHQLSNGQVKWQTTLSNLTTIVDGSLIQVSDNLVILAQDGSLRMAKASPDRYQEICCSPARSAYATYLNSPSYSNGKLYIRDPFKMLCLDLTPPPALRVQASWSLESDRFCLTLACTNGTAIATNRIAKIGLLWSTDLTQPVAEWTRTTTPLRYTNGTLACEEELATNGPARFYEVIEQR